MLEILNKIINSISILLISKFRNYNSVNKKNTTYTSLGIDTNKDLMYLEEPGTGYLSGPECFSLKSHEGYYLLDTTKKVILSLDSNNEKNNVFTYNNLLVSKIASDNNDTLYIIDPINKIIGKIDNNNNIENFFIDDINTNPLIDFGVRNNGNPFIVVADENGGKTYEVELLNNKAKLVSIKNGRLSTNNEKNYKTTLIKDKGFNLGHSCNITIFDESGNIEKELILKSSHWIEGAVYIGELNGNFIVKTHEVEIDINNNIIFEELIKEIDIHNNIIGILALPPKHKYIQNDVKIKDSFIYHLNCQQATCKMEKLELSSPDIFKSSLEKQSLKSNNTLTNSSTTSSSLSAINRSSIQETAKAYFNYTWYCSESNFLPYRKSIRPAYIKSSNVYYQRIPYSWGGWDSLDGFASKISQGNTAGNIYTKRVYPIIAGVDCSGYVQRCWQINDSKHNTTMLDYPSISYRIDLTNIKFGDAWNSRNHIMIYESSDGYGNYLLYESTLLGENDGVAYTARAISYVQSNYHLIRRLNISENS